MLPFILDSRYSPDACRPAGAMLFGSLEQPIIQSDTITDRGCFMNLTVTRFYFHPSDPYRRTPVGIVSRRISPFPIVSCLGIYIYIYMYMDGKKGRIQRWNFFFFSIPLFFQLVVIFVIFLRKSDRATGSYFLSHLGREYDR